MAKQLDEESSADDRKAWERTLVETMVEERMRFRLLKIFGGGKSRGWPRPAMN